MSQSYITDDIFDSQRHILLKHASHLAPVIIAGCREEIQLQKLQNEIAIELEAMKNEKKSSDAIPPDDAELSSKIAGRLNSRGI